MVYPTGSNLVSVVVAVELYVRVRFAGRIWRGVNLGFEFQELHFAILLVKVCFFSFSYLVVNTIYIQMSTKKKAMKKEVKKNKVDLFSFLLSCFLFFSCLVSYFAFCRTNSSLISVWRATSPSSTPRECSTRLPPRPIWRLGRSSLSPMSSGGSSWNKFIVSSPTTTTTSWRRWWKSYW